MAVQFFKSMGFEGQYKQKFSVKSWKIINFTIQEHLIMG